MGTVHNIIVADMIIIIIVVVVVIIVVVIVVNCHACWASISKSHIWSI